MCPVETRMKIGDVVDRDFPITLPGKEGEVSFPTPYGNAGFRVICAEDDMSGEVHAVYYPPEEPNGSNVRRFVTKKEPTLPNTQTSRLLAKLRPNIPFIFEITPLAMFPDGMETKVHLIFELKHITTSPNGH